MNGTTLIKNIVLAFAIAGIGLAPASRAAHTAAYLDALAADVETRLAAVDENTTAAERRALTSASKILNRNSKTLAADLGLLAQAATSLEAGFPGDSTFAGEEEFALDAYSADAQVQLETTAALAGTNALPRSLSNLLAQAQGALDRGNDDSNSVPVRAKAIAFAFNKLKAASTQARRVFKAPVSLNDTITLNGRGGSGSVTLDSTGTYEIPGDPDSELGTWSYERTSANTATVTLTPVGGDARTIDLKFNNSSRGSFNGTSASGEPFKGQFTITEVE